MGDKNIVGMIAVDEFLHDALCQAVIAGELLELSQTAIDAHNEVTAVNKLRDKGRYTGVAAQKLYEKMMSRSSVLWDVGLPDKLNRLSDDHLHEAACDAEQNIYDWQGGCEYIIYTSEPIDVGEDVDPFYMHDVVLDVDKKYRPRLMMIRMVEYDSDLLMVYRSWDTAVGELRYGEEIFDKKIARISMFPIEPDEDDMCSAGLVSGVHGLPKYIEELYFEALNEVASRRGMSVEQVLWEERA